MVARFLGSPRLSPKSPTPASVVLTGFATFLNTSSFFFFFFSPLIALPFRDSFLLQSDFAYCSDLVGRPFTSSASFPTSEARYSPLVNFALVLLPPCFFLRRILPSRFILLAKIPYGPYTAALRAFFSLFLRIVVVSVFRSARPPFPARGVLVFRPRFFLPLNF